MPIAHVRGVDLFYETAGHSGDPVVLVHGSLVDHTAWARVVPLLSDALTVLVYDRRGFGRSTLGPRQRPVATDVADLAGLLEAVDLLPVHVVTYSYGGAVALRLAADRPELVRSIAIHEPPLFGMLIDQPATAAEGERFLRGISEIRDLVARREVAEAARQVVEVFSLAPGAWERLPPNVRAEFAARMDRWVEEYTDPDSLRPPSAALPELLLPVLLTGGAESPSFLREIRGALARELPNVTEVDLPGVGHAPHLTHPVDYAGLLLSFLMERNVPSH
jgi:pimeloyl-ACP methyl ester carboxylesterase